jgi:hypothetical protein
VRPDGGPEWAALGHPACHMSQVPGAHEADLRRFLERLARTGWLQQAGVQVRSVTVAGARAEVALAVNGNDGYWVYYERDGSGWEETMSGNSPTTGRADPSAATW